MEDGRIFARAALEGLSRPLLAAAALMPKLAAETARMRRPERDLLAARLAADMFPLARQYEIAADGARGAAFRLAGLRADPPDRPDWAVFDRGGEGGFGPADATIEAVRGRLERAASDIAALDPRRLSGAAARQIRVSRAGRARVFDGFDFLVHYALPNLAFHLAVAHGILRREGLAVGKADFEGQPVYLVEEAEA